jgi:hypothetical protein
MRSKPTTNCLICMGLFGVAGLGVAPARAISVLVPRSHWTYDSVAYHDLVRNPFNGLTAGSITLPASPIVISGGAEAVELPPGVGAAFADPGGGFVGAPIIAAAGGGAVNWLTSNGGVPGNGPTVFWTAGPAVSHALWGSPTTMFPSGTPAAGGNPNAQPNVASTSHVGGSTTDVPDGGATAGLVAVALLGLFLLRLRRVR